MNLIVNIRGTHGSGKSTVIRTMMSRYGAERLGKGKRPDGYRINLPDIKSPLYVVGPYETACGGCDAIQPYALIWPRVEEYAALGHVVFEGALVSSSYGNIGRASEAYGNRFVFAFMDTPLQVCLDRVASRRKARGDDRPLDPKNTTVKYNNVLRSIPTIRAAGRRLVTIDHRFPVHNVLRLFRASEA